MIVDEHVPLSDLTTLRVGGNARYVLNIDTVDDLKTALVFVRERGLAYVALGEGSNVLPPDEGYPGALLRIRIQGMTYESHEGTTFVSVGAGVHWDEMVRECATRGLWGIENLAGIPGTVGAAPVQNIGAYGAELQQTLHEVEAFDAVTHEMRTFRNEECRFGYRDSRFKHEPNLIITRVTFALLEAGTPRIGYADLTAVAQRGEDLSSPTAIGEAVREIRSHKFPDLAEFGTAGSFFKNPILSETAFRELAERYGAVPSFPQVNGIKVPLAFILDRVLNLKGYRKGAAFLFGNQPLVLVADEGARASDIDALAREIETRVHDTTGITIEREVRDLSFHEYHLD